MALQYSSKNPLVSQQLGDCYRWGVQWPSDAGIVINPQEIRQRMGAVMEGEIKFDGKGY